MSDVDVQAGGTDTRYKIGDVCRIADVQPYVLRYWESEFPALAPDKSQTGSRTYSVRELRVIEQIKKLLYDEGYRIDGAKRRLRELHGEEPAVQVKALASNLRTLLTDLEKIVDDDEES